MTIDGKTWNEWTQDDMRRAWLALCEKEGHEPAHPPAADFGKQRVYKSLHHRRKKVVAAYSRLRNMRKVAAEIGISHYTVAEDLAKSGISTRRRRNVWEDGR